MSKYLQAEIYLKMLSVNIFEVNRKLDSFYNVASSLRVSLKS